MEEITCFRCDGTQVNKKGLPCRRCNGSGILKNKFFSELVVVLREEIKSYTTQTFQKMMASHFSDKK
jgi:DnaJ-class molecular chaperone